MRPFTSAKLAWTLGVFAASLAVVLALAVFRERHQRDVERAQLDEARAARQKEEDRARSLADQLAALNRQMSALGDRVSGLERSNRALKRRLANARAPSDMATLAASIEPRVPDIAAPELGASVEMHLVGETTPPLAGVNLSPTGEWPVVERRGVPTTNRFTDPAFMNTMYVSYGVLQAADIATTLAGLQHGGKEANPVLRGVAGHPAALIGVKVAATAGTVFMVEKLRKRKPLTAAMTMIAVNSALAIVAVNNARAIKEHKRP